MTVDELVDILMDKLVEGELTGSERVADSGLFAVTGVEIVPTHDGTSYVLFVSKEYEEAQAS